MRLKFIAGFICGAILVSTLYWLTVALRPPAAVRPLEQQEIPKVLVFRFAMFEGTTVLVLDQVEVRPLKDEEMENFRNAKHRYVPPFPQAVIFKSLARNIEADVPLLKDDFYSIAPGTPSPGMNSVRLRLLRRQVVGDVPRTGDRVSVYLTRGERHEAQTSKIPLVEAKVLGVGGIWRVPEWKEPMALEMNPYREALVKFAMNHGELQIRSAPMVQGNPFQLDQANEEDRVKAFLGGQPITDGDLEEFFDGPLPEQRRPARPPFHLPDIEPRGILARLTPGN